MINFQSGVLERTRLVSNILMIILVAGNIFFSIQYIGSIELQKVEASDKEVTRLQTSRFLKFFIDTVINTQGTISFDDRVKLENDVRQLHDSVITAQWDAFVQSKDSKAAQQNAVKLMSILTSKML